MKKKQPELIDAVTIDRYADMLRTSEIFERLFELYDVQGSTPIPRGSSSVLVVAWLKLYEQVEKSRKSVGMPFDNQVQLRLDKIYVVPVGIELR